MPGAPGAPDRCRSSRLIAAYMDRPLLPENFSAEEMLDTWSGRTLQDWKTFHQAGTRLVDYLHYAGYNGLVLSVAADGSAIYPSQVLEPTPRYDTGVFFASGQDPMPKDVLEMLLRLMDRENLQLIPALEFATPLPALEAIRRRGGSGGPRIGVDRAPTAARGARPIRAPRPGPLLQHARSAGAGSDALGRAGTGPALRRPRELPRPGPAALGLRLRPASRSRLGHGRRHDRPLRARHRRAGAGQRCTLALRVTNLGRARRGQG